MTVLGVATGVPLLTIGAERMRAYRQWRREHRELGALLEHLQISAGGSRAGLSVTERF